MTVRLRLVSVIVILFTIESRGMTETQVIVPDSKGLLAGSFNPDEPVAANGQEVALGLKPDPRISQIKPFYLYVPKAYAKDKPPPLLIWLHERGPLGQFSTRTALGKNHLEACTKRSLVTWRELSEKEGFLLMVPLGDPDILWMGVSWFTGSRPKLFEAITQTVGKTHAYDKSRVYVVGSGEGAHSAVATAVRGNDLLAAVAACNPPLFDGKSLKGNTVYPETVDEMLTDAGKRKVPFLILAGNKDKESSIVRHAVFGSVRNDRFQDSSGIPAEQIKKMAEKLKNAGFPIEFKTIPTPHYAPLPTDHAEITWNWMKEHKIDLK